MRRHSGTGMLAACLILFSAAGGLSAQTDGEFSAQTAGEFSAQSAPQSVFPEDSLVEVIKKIPLEPLEVLPVSDCKLDALEQAANKFHTYTGTLPSAKFSYYLQKKRAQIDFMRSYIDSLYYVQALQAVNRPEPDYEKAMQNVEKSLRHNRFFARSVVFKMNYLLKHERNAQLCLRYLNQTLREFSSNPKVNNAAQTTYNTMLEQTGLMLRNGLYQDALDLCEITAVYCQDVFPVYYQRYKEKQLQNLAYQGLYISFFEVAQKAWRQEQYQLAQKYALKAFHYYLDNEPHMAGVNFAIELLDKIASVYLDFAAASEPEERYYYTKLVEEIVEETGLREILHTPYSVDEEIAHDMAWVNRPAPEPEPEPEWETADVPEPVAVPESEAVPEPVTVAVLQPEPAATPAPAPMPAPTPASAPKAAPIAAPKPAVKLKPAEAKKQYENLCALAFEYGKQRQFLSSWLQYDSARILASEYKLKTDADFAGRYAQTAVLAVEQILNKAVYYLWNHKEQTADSLQNTAQNLAERYMQLCPDDASTHMRLKQWLATYQDKAAETACKKLEKNMADGYAGFYRQAGFGNMRIAANELLKIEENYGLYGNGRYAACVPDAEKLQQAQNLMLHWREYETRRGKALDYWRDSAESAQFDVEKLVNAYAYATGYYDSLELKKYLGTYTGLFGLLSNAGDLETLSKWSKLCYKQGNTQQFEFIYGYLQGAGYKEADLEKQARKVKKQKAAK